MVYFKDDHTREKMSVNYDGKFGLKKTLESLIVYRVIAVVLALASAATAFMPWVYIKINKVEDTKTMLGLGSFNDWFSSLKSYTKALTSTNEKTITLLNQFKTFRAVLMVVYVLTLIVLVVSIVCAVMLFIKGKKQWVYNVYRTVSLITLSVVAVMFLLIMSLPNSKSAVFFNGLFKFQLAPFIMMLCEIIAYLVVSKKLVDDSVAVGFFYPETIPSLPEYKEFLETAEREEAAAVAMNAPAPVAKKVSK